MLVIPCIVPEIPLVFIAQDTAFAICPGEESSLNIDKYFCYYKNTIPLINVVVIYWYKLGVTH